MTVVVDPGGSTSGLGAGAGAAGSELAGTGLCAILLQTKVLSRTSGSTLEPIHRIVICLPA
jgi:hypothetical protein